MKFHNDDKYFALKQKKNQSGMQMFCKYYEVQFNKQFSSHCFVAIEQFCKITKKENIPKTFFNFDLKTKKRKNEKTSETKNKFQSNKKISKNIF